MLLHKYLHLCNTSGSNDIISDDLGLLGCDAMSLVSVMKTLHCFKMSGNTNQ